MTLKHEILFKDKGPENGLYSQYLGSLFTLYIYTQESGFGPLKRVTCFDKSMTCSKRFDLNCKTH